MKKPTIKRLRRSKSTATTPCPKTPTEFRITKGRRKIRLGRFPTLEAVREEIFAGELFSQEQQQLQRERNANNQMISAFHEEQRKTWKWIHLHSIAERCSETAEPTLPPEKKEDLYVNALISLLKSALAGEFEIDRRSWLLRVHHDYTIEPAWLTNPDTAPPPAFVSREELQQAASWPAALPSGGSETDRKRLTSKGKVARYIIANCWIPRELAVRWLKSRRPPITIPAAWNVHPERSTKRRPTQNNIREELAQKAPQYLDGPHDQTSWAIAEILVGKTAGANKRHTVDKKRKALERYYAALKAAR